MMTALWSAEDSLSI